MLTRATTAKALLVTTVAASLVFACNNAADSLTSRTGTKTGTGSTGATLADGGVDTSGGGTPEKALFDKVEPDFMAHCANGCHDTGTSAAAPTFLAGPDVYASLKKHNGVITADVFSSVILTKGPHSGPAVSSLPDMQARVIDWLNAEAALLTAAALPTTPAFAVTSGTNTIDLTPAATGVTGVGLRFDAALVGTMLQLTNITVTTSAGSDVHVLQPKFVRVLATAAADGSKETEDPADSFSNADQTIAAGKEAILSPGSVLFSGGSWRSFDMASDKIRIEMTKLEAGTVSATAAQATCKDAAGFASKVLPGLKATQAANGTCGGCHGNGTAGMSLNSADTATVCEQVLGKLNTANLAQSLLFTKLAPGASHGGGQANDLATFRALITNNSSVFF